MSVLQGARDLSPVPVSCSVTECRIRWRARLSRRGGLVQAGNRRGDCTEDISDGEPRSIHGMWAANTPTVGRQIGCALDITDIGDGENGPTSVEESWVPSHWLPCAAMEIASPELPERILDANGMPLGALDVGATNMSVKGLPPTTPSCLSKAEAYGRHPPNGAPAPDSRLYPPANHLCQLPHKVGDPLGVRTCVTPCLSIA